jgi:hypothetical protein
VESIPAGATDDSRTYQASVGFVAEKFAVVTADDGGWLMRRTAEGFFFKKK